MANCLWCRLDCHILYPANIAVIVNQKLSERKQYDAFVVLHFPFFIDVDTDFSYIHNASQMHKAL